MKQPHGPLATLARWMTDTTTPIDSGDLERHRPALTGHCYRMLGSPDEADDAVQESFVRAWRSLDRFEQRSSLRTWLYSIATRVCLDALGSVRRVRPMEPGWGRCTTSCAPVPPRTSSSPSGVAGAPGRRRSAQRASP